MLWATKFRGKGAIQISDRILQIWVTVDHVAKFGDDWPSHIGHQAVKKRKKEN